MEYRLTDHAKDVVAEREIPVEWLERILANPERVETDRSDPELEHHLGRIAEYENRVLRVILNKVESPPVIVTVYFDRGMRNGL